MEISKRLFYSNAIYYFLGIVGGGMINFFSIPLIIGRYGVAEYGKYTLIQNIILIIISFGSGWLNQNILRFNDSSQTFKWNIICFYYLSLLPLVIFSLFFVLILKYNLTIAIIASFTVAIGGLTAIMNTFYQSNLNAKKNVLFDLFRVVGFVICVYLLSFYQKQVDTVLLLIISFFISYLIAFFFKLKSDFSQLFIIFKSVLNSFNMSYVMLFFKRNKFFFNYGWPLSLWFTISSVLNVGDRYIINIYLTKTDLGIYSAIYDLLYKGVSVAFTPILAAGYPIISKYYNNDERGKAYSFLRKLIFFEILILIVGFIVSLYFDKFFLEHIVRINYTEDIAKLVSLILIGAIVWQIAMLVHKPLELELKTRMMLIFVLMALIANAALNFVFIPKFGLIAAAYNSIVSVSLYLLLSLIYVVRNRRWNI